MNTHDRIIPLRVEAWSHKNSLIPPHFIEVPTFRLSTIFLLGFRNVPDEWYFRNVLTKFDIYVFIPTV